MIPRADAGALALALVLVGALATGCVPVLTPPLVVGGGGAVRVGGDAGYRFSAGTHVASLIPDHEFPLDVGAGYVQTSTVSNGNQVEVHGLYVDGGPRLAGGRFWRVFAGPRAEYYFAPQTPDAAYAGLVRTQIELMVPTELEPIAGASQRDFYIGIAYGVLAIGAYAEGGYQKLPTDAGLPMFGGGLYLRVPATLGLLCCAWDLSKKK